VPLLTHSLAFMLLLFFVSSDSMPTTTATKKASRKNLQDKASGAAGTATGTLDSSHCAGSDVAAAEAVVPPARGIAATYKSNANCSKRSRAYSNCLSQEHQRQERSSTLKQGQRLRKKKKKLASFTKIEPSQEKSMVSTSKF
jgi:hypothetical protein